MAKQLASTPTTLKGAFYLMLLLFVMARSASARMLDEQHVGPVTTPVAAPPPSDSIPAPADPPTDPADAPSQPDPASADPAASPAEPNAAAAQPAAAPAQPNAAATPPQPVGTSQQSDHPLTFFMHDILGGSKPSARIVTGLVANTAANGQLPFSRPNKDIFPIQGALPLPSGVNNVINSNNAPYVAGLGGTTTTIIQNNGNAAANGGSNALPFVNGANLPSGATLQNLLFGTTTVFDDEITEGHEIGTGMIGRAQGFYVASSQDGTSKTLVLTAVFEGEGGEYADTISFFGVHRTAAPESHIAVIGGTGKYEDAKGFAAVQTLQPADSHTTDGVETLLQFSVHLL